MTGRVRIGKVTDVYEEQNAVRVVFPESGLVSGLLCVVQRGDDWLPEIDDIVLCVYLDGADADGYVLGLTGVTS